MNKSIEKSVSWAKQITALHEQLAPNSYLEMQMDLHNNMVGRVIFIEHQLYQESQETIISVLEEKIITAILIETAAEVENYTNEFVYLQEL